MGMSMKKAYLSEVFSSIQGEGLLVGVRQIFVRFAGCSLTCDYCDTPESRTVSRDCRVYGPENPAAFRLIQNPVSSREITEIIDSFNIRPGIHHSISLTGGEPLEQAEFLNEWLPELRERTDLKIYIETNGLLYERLAGVIDEIDIVGMDMKLPSAAGISPAWDRHREFLKTAIRKETFVKVVVNRNTSEEELLMAADIVGSVSSTTPFIIQPEFPIDIDAEEILRMQEKVSGKLSDVRVIIQLHKFLKAR